MKYLPPLRLKKAYWQPIEAQINEIFAERIYRPLFAIVKKAGYEIQNSINSIIDALNSERIYYEDGLFLGDFNSKISKSLSDLGAVWDWRKKGWALSSANIPIAVNAAIRAAEKRFTMLRNRLVHEINTLNPDPDIDGEIDYLATIGQFDDDFIRSVESVAIKPKLNEATKKRIAASWGKNLELYIKDWTAENIVKLRSEIMSNALRGQRADNLVKLLQRNYGTSKSKAKFLARQETSLLVSAMRKERYQEIGVNRYKWDTSHDERVRPVKGTSGMFGNHRILDGHIFRFDDPPVTNMSTGARNNPGEDFGCRCVAIAIVD